MARDQRRNEPTAVLDYHYDDLCKNIPPAGIAAQGEALDPIDTTTPDLEQVLLTHG